MERPFNFPVWLFVNRGGDANSPQSVLKLDSLPHHAPFPVTLPVFLAEETARQSRFGHPYVPVEVDRDTFCEFLQNDRSIEIVVLDYGTESAVSHRAEEVIARLCET